MGQIMEQSGRERRNKAGLTVDSKLKLEEQQSQAQGQAFQEERKE